MKILNVVVNTRRNAMAVHQSSRDICEVNRIIEPVKTSDGAGVNLSRSIGSHLLSDFDPFLLLDEFGSENPNDYVAGFPDHPHRGFETVTYMLNGRLEHKDSAGNTGIIESGGVQWMTAGRGVIHSEMPKQENGLMRGFQLWVNLPAKEKMKEPYYQNIDKEMIPVYRLESGSAVRVIAGTSNGIEGIIKGIQTQPLFLDVHLKSNTPFHQDLDNSHNSFIYVYEGELLVGGRDNKKIRLKSGLLGLLTRGETLAVETTDTEAKFICLSGKPLDESIVRHDPFVMNRIEEIEQALSDFQRGRLVT
jgi:hypothetical protein